MRPFFCPDLDLQCSHLVCIFLTLILIWTFLKKLVWKWSGLTPKSSDLTKYGEKMLKIGLFEHASNSALDDMQGSESQESYLKS